MTTRVLLVDPDEFIVTAFARVLTRYGFEVLTPSCGRESEQHLCESAPHVLVLEPDTDDGWGQRLLLRKDSTNAIVPTVVVSRQRFEDMKFTSEPEVFCWMTKPVSTNDLVTIVGDATLHDTSATR